MFFDLQKLVSDFSIQVGCLIFLFMLVGIVRGLASQRWGTFVSSLIFGIACLIVANYDRVQAITTSLWNLIKSGGMA